MNSQFPNSPEDRLLDELLREQAHGPDEAFLQQIEAAVDAEPPLANKLPPARHYGRLAIAAGVALVAGSFAWSSFQNRHQHAAVSSADRENAEKEKAALELEKLTKSIRDQEDKVEERRKVLATIVRSQGVIHKGQDSFYALPGIDEDQAARGALQSYNELQTQKTQAESQINSLLKYDGDEQMRFASGLDLPDNTVKSTYPEYLESKRQLDELKINGLGNDHPSVRATEEKQAAMKRQLDEGVIKLRANLQARLAESKDRLKNVPAVKNATHEEAIKRGLVAQEYADAKRDFENDQQELQLMKQKLAALKGEKAERTEIAPDLMAKKRLAGITQEMSKQVSASGANLVVPFPDSSEIIAAKSSSGENKDVLPHLIGKLRYVKDESLAWVLRPGYGVDGRFPIKYEDSSHQTNKTGTPSMIGPGDSFFLTGPMANRFKLLGSKVRREMSKTINTEHEVVIVRVQDQRPNKKGAIYEFPSPLPDDARKNQFLKYDRAAVFSLEAIGMEGNEFKVEENTTFSLPPGGEKKDYRLKSVTPAGVVIEMVDGGQTVKISKGEMPAGEALAALAEHSAGRPQRDIRDEAIKSDLTGSPGSSGFDPNLPLLPPLPSSGSGSVAGKGAGAADDKVLGSNVRVIRHQDGSRSVFSRSPDGSDFSREMFAPNGVLMTRAIYKIDDNGNPLGCMIYDGQEVELYKVSYGYSKSTGQLVEELVFDSRMERINSDTGREMPVQKVTYPYDAGGKRGEPVVFNLLPGKTFDQIFGLKIPVTETYPFEVARILAKGKDAESQQREVSPPAEKAEVVPGDRNR